MMSDYALTNSEVLIPEFGLSADCLPSVSSNDFSIIGLDNEEIDTLASDQEETVVYIPYDGEYTYFNNLDDALSTNTYIMFVAFGIGIISLGIVALFKVSIDLFKKITK